MEKLFEEMKGMADSRLASKDLLPTIKEERTLSPLEFWFIWVGISVLLTTFIIGADLYPHLGAAQILGAVILGNVVVAIVVAFTGDIGVNYGIPFAVYLRACYGYSGTHVPSIIRAMPAIFWLGFQTWLGAEAINIILGELVPAWTGTTTHVTGIIVVFMAVQVVTTGLGIDWIKGFEKIVAPLMVAIGIGILVWIQSAFELSVAEILRTPPGEVVGPRYSFWYAITAMTGYWATMSLNIPDFTRFLQADRDEPSWFKRNWRVIWPSMFGIVPTMAFFAFIGTASMVATGEWNPVFVIAAVDAPILLVLVALIIVVLAQWSTNIGANILPPGFIFTNVFSPKVNFFWACILSGVIALIMRPWVFADVLIDVFAIISITLGGIAGTMISDYYLLRGRTLNIKEMFKVDGQYKYWKNINPAGFIAYVVGFGVGYLFMAIGFFAALFAAGIAYYLLMKYWIVNNYPQPEITEHLKLDK